MGERHLISTGVRSVRCGCGGWTLVAIAEGISVAIDPAIVDEITELTALIQGRRSFDLIRISGRIELMHRDATRQRRRKYPVSLEHPCGRPAIVDDPIDSWKKKKTIPAADTRVPVASSKDPAASPPPF